MGENKGRKRSEKRMSVSQTTLSKFISDIGIKEFPEEMTKDSGKYATHPTE